jgi:hypothetical protein
MFLNQASNPNKQKATVTSLYTRVEWKWSTLTYLLRGYLKIWVHIIEIHDMLFYLSWFSVKTGTNSVFEAWFKFFEQLFVNIHNGHISVIFDLIKKIRVLCFLHFLKLKKAKWRCFIDWRSIERDMASHIIGKKLIWKLKPGFQTKNLCQS